MLTAKEANFVERWEKERIVQSGFLNKLLRGLPMAILFTLPIYVSLIVVYKWSPEWYTKFASRLNSGMLVILIALALIIVFFAYMRMHFKWEMNEQLYREIKAKQSAEHNAA